MGSGAGRKGLNYLVFSIILLIVGVSITIVQYKVPSILETIMDSYGMDSSIGSWMMSIFTAVGIFLALPTGSLAKKLGPKRVLLFGCAVIVVGSVIGAFATSAWMMILSRGVEGVAFVLITVAGPLAIEKYVSKEHQGTANGIWSLWICFGSVIGSTATPMVFEALGLRGTWLAYAAIVVVTALVLAVAVRDPETGTVLPDASSSEAAAEEAVADQEKGGRKGYSSLINPNALLYFFTYLIFNIEILAVLSYTPTFLQGEGMNASLSGFASSLPGLLAIVAALVFGRLIDMTGRTKVFYVVAAAVAGPATFLMLTQSGPLLWVGAVLMGLIGYGIPVAGLSSLPQIAGSKEMMPAAVGVFMLVQSFGEFLGSFLTPILLGPGMDNWLLCGMVIGALGILSAVAIAICRFK